MDEKPKTQDTETHPDNLILVCIAQMRKGKLVRRLSEAMQEVIDAVKANGKTGRVTLHLDVKMAVGASDEVHITDDVVTKTPKPDKQVSFFYLNEEDRLTKDDPSKQVDIFRDRQGNDPADNAEQEQSEAQ
tara:strand:- start:729 stop:1121 length:393 start_codon:yes stop_codon:yes gene_type:complete